MTATPPAVWWSPSRASTGRLGLLVKATTSQVSAPREFDGELPADAVRLIPAASGLPEWTTCPTCSSSRPHLHPTEDLCPDPFHQPEPATAQEWRAEVTRWADLLDQIGHLPAGTGLDAVARIVADMRRELAAPLPTKES